MTLTVERAMNRDVSQKVIVSHLGAKGLQLSMGGFRSMLEAERTSRAQTGDHFRCESCGSILPAIGQQQTNAGIEGTS